MEGLLRRKKHLGTFVGRHVPSDNSQHLPQGPFGEAKRNISIPGLCSAHGQANDLASCKAELRATDKTW